MPWGYLLIRGVIKCGHIIYISLTISINLSLLFIGIITLSNKTISRTY